MTAPECLSRRGASRGRPIHHSPFTIHHSSVALHGRRPTRRPWVRPIRAHPRFPRSSAVSLPLPLPLPLPSPLPLPFAVALDVVGPCLRDSDRFDPRLKRGRCGPERGHGLRDEVVQARERFAKIGGRGVEHAQACLWITHLPSATLASRAGEEGQLQEHSPRISRRTRIAAAAVRASAPNGPGSWRRPGTLLAGREPRGAVQSSSLPAVHGRVGALGSHPRSSASIRGQCSCSWVDQRRMPAAA
jgi:hypothetical protein